MLRDGRAATKAIVVNVPLILTTLVEDDRKVLIDKKDSD